MPTYVLVHGAWHGGWCWRRVVRGLVAPGIDVHAPTLTGLGERAHLASREVGVETHIRDVLGVLEAEDLTEVVLVAHSYGGIVSTAVADRAPSRIARLVYLDAVVPHDGQCLYDCASAQARTHFEEQARIAGDGWQIPTAAASAQFLGLTREEDVRWVMPRLTPHPIRTFREGVRLGSESLKVVRSYINCIGNKPFGQPKSSQAKGIDDYHELQTGHDAMVTVPQELVELLHSFTQTERRGARPGTAGSAA